MQEMQRPFVINGTSVDVSASIGIAVEGTEAGQRSRLLTRATAALAEAKDLGRNRYTVFNVLMGASVSEVELMVGDLRRGLRENEFYLVYQPKLDMQSGRLIGMEALLRWNHPEHGQVAPDHFVPLAEKTGMIVDIGRWVLNEACRQMQVWRSEHVIDWRVSVNASVFQLNAASFYGDVLDALERNALDPEDLCIEITESEAMRNAELSLMTLHRLSAAGVRISLDDFGVGHSSLSHLKRFPVQELKIDRSFISGIAECPESEAIVRAIIGLAKAVGLQVVAEGVETEEQQALLAEMDCDVIQGYLISRPVRPEDVSALVTRYNATHGVLNRLLES
jgi:EAL domain-containing protein (putative c-di-GMP-specific phosphodiesterase class I)